MSGILAMVWTGNRQADPAILNKLTSQLAYRGPDEQNTWWNEHAGLGHALLRVDAREVVEHQTFSMDEKVRAVADARIDDQDVLKAKIRHRRADAAPLVSKVPDTSLIVEAYRCFGLDSAGQLVGDFAFAIWDEPAQRLFAAVDRF